MAGRPVKYTKEKLEEIRQAIEDYTKKTKIPILAEFAYKNDIRRGTLYDMPELSDAIKALIDKKESQLEKLALDQKVNTTMAIFSLKQIGWKDKQEVEHTGGVKIIKDSIPDE